MTANEIILNEYFYPFNQLSERDFAKHRFIRLPPRSCVSSAFVTNGNYGGLLNALKVDKLRLLKKLIATKHISETWLKFCTNADYKSFMFFNIDIKYGYKIVANTKAIYGHKALLIIPSDVDRTAEISKSIQGYFRQDTVISKVFDCFSSPFYFIFPKPRSSLRFDTKVHFLFNFTKDFTLPLSHVLADFKTLIQKPLHIIGLEPHEINTSDVELQKAAETVINLILIGLKTRYAIEKDFPLCTGIILDQGNTKMTEKIAQISTNQLKLSTAMGLKRSSEVKDHILDAYQNISALMDSIFLQYSSYFSDDTVFFPKIPFAETLLEDLKQIYFLLANNFTTFSNHIFFKWNESTKEKMLIADEGAGAENYGIVVTQESYKTIKEMHDSFGNNIFWALNLESNFNNIEPLLFIDHRETQFGFVEFPNIEEEDKSEEDRNGEEHFFTPCECNSPHFRLWICRSCWNLVKVRDSGTVCCGCGIQKVCNLQKECFQCILNSRTNVSAKIKNTNFKEARNQLSSFFRLQDPPKKRPKKLKKVEIIPPDPHISVSSLDDEKIIPKPPILIPAIPTAPPPSDGISLALEELHESVIAATELCNDVLQKVGKKDGSEVVTEVPETPLIEKPLEVLKQKVEEALEYVEEIKEHEENRVN